MFTVVIALILGLLAGLAVKSLFTYHQSSPWLTDAIRRRQEAEHQAALCQRKADRLASELAIAEQEVSHLTRQHPRRADTAP